MCVFVSYKADITVDSSNVACSLHDIIEHFLLLVLNDNYSLTLCIMHMYIFDDFEL
jgi:hypothetical protein